MKKVMALALAATMTLGMTTVGMAQTVDTGKGGNASVTITNAAKGENYTVYKLFDASVTGNEDGSIAYTGTIPEDLADFFTKDAAGNISATAAAGTGEAMSGELKVALTKWAESATALGTGESIGEELTFESLPYGYYVVTTSQGNQLISVDSTNPNMEIVDKNLSEPNTLEKTVNDENVNIGDSVEYTVTFNTSNYDGAGTEAMKITKYEIEDTLPKFLTNVKITRITIDGEELKDDDGVVVTADNLPQFTQLDSDAPLEIYLTWTDDGTATGTSKYDNSANVSITYTADVTNDATIDKDKNNTTEANINTVNVKWYSESTPGNETLTETEEIFTYATGLKKVDENGNPLDGAKFAVKGLIVSGSDGNYTVVSYDPSTDAVNGTTMVTDDNGYLVIKGLAIDETLVVTETEAPAGYNKLVDTVNLTPVETGKQVIVTTKTVYYDAEGNEVQTEEDSETSETIIEFDESLATKLTEIENKKGIELPSTGGMGTTIFYVLGSILALGAGVLLVTKKRVGEN